MNHRYTSLITGAALAVSLVLAPAVTFAEVSHPATPGHSSFFSGFANWFDQHTGAKVARADTDNDTDGTTTGSTTPPSHNLPPSISGVSSPTVLEIGATGTWFVSASDPENGNLSYSVDWGDQGILHAFAAMLAQPFVQTSTFTHSYAHAGNYTVKFTVKDDGGRMASSSVTVHVVRGTAQTLSLADVAASSTSQTHATITWTSTLRSDSTIFYSTTTPVSTSTAASATGSAHALNHRVNLTGLTASTTYYYIVTSKDAAGETATSSESSFTTPAAVNGAPTISGVTAMVGDNGITFNWNTNVAADSELYYSTTSPVTIGATSTTPITDATLETSHSLKVSNLAAGTTYYFVIQSADANASTTATHEFSLTTMSL